jgi:hypothetical protein
VSRVALLLGLSTACAVHQDPVGLYQTGSYAEALTQQETLAETPGKEQILENVRLASMALAQGDETLAEQALRRAVPGMQSFQAEGEWQATLGAEEAKEWKGEPYEKMAAFFYLGCLLYEKGDYGNALAMFKSTVLADTGTAEERYRSDFVPAWVMEALTFRALGEDGNADQATARAVDGIFSRVLIGMLDDLVEPLASVNPSRETWAAKAALLTALSAAVSDVTDPSGAAKMAVSHAGDLLRVEAEKPEKERLPIFQHFSREELKGGLDALGPLADTFRNQAARIPSSALDGPRAQAEKLETVLKAPPNVLLLVEAGRGPQKMAVGRYGEKLQIVPSGPQPVQPVADTPQGPLPEFYLDSYTFQATTRGGRKVDSFLKGKAIFKDTSLIGGEVLMELGNVAEANRNGELATALYVVGGLSFLAGAATNPAADVREWALLPDELWLVAATLPPGPVALHVGGRDRTLDVPENGRVFALIPDLPPGGASNLRSR